MDKNIQESKEFRLAKDLEMAVNSFSFNPKRFAAAIPTMHPTLQQSLYRLIKECIKVMADDTRYYDDRNMASHEEAKCMMEYLNKYRNVWHGHFLHYGIPQYERNIPLNNWIMKTKEYFFGGNTYVCRIVQANDGEELVIAPTALLDVIQPGSFEDENEGFANKEAEYIYDEIFFFTDAETLALPEEQFIEEMKKDNREWFE